MNIPERLQKLKGLLSKDFIILMTLVLTSGISFSFGYLAGKDTIKQEVFIDTSAAVYNAQIGEKGAFVGSISGTKYHLLHCSGAKRIKEENKVYFDTKEDAQLAGYAPAANCEGL
tara:strand:+ start:130886 stop:131230 length:345 start_codon:yes stop_codon:yes gene_type:complete